MISNRRLAGAYLAVLVALIYGVMTGENISQHNNYLQHLNITFRLLHKVLGVQE